MIAVCRGLSRAPYALRGRAARAAPHPAQRRFARRGRLRAAHPARDRARAGPRSPRSTSARCCASCPPARSRWPSTRRRSSGVARLERDRSAWYRWFDDPERRLRHRGPRRRQPLLRRHPLRRRAQRLLDAASAQRRDHPPRRARPHHVAARRCCRRSIGLNVAMGMPFSPTFYLSIDDWMLEYAEEAMDDLDASSDQPSAARPCLLGGLRTDRLSRPFGSAHSLHSPVHYPHVDEGRRMRRLLRRAPKRETMKDHFERTLVGIGSGHADIRRTAALQHMGAQARSRIEHRHDRHRAADVRSCGRLRPHRGSPRAVEHQRRLGRAQRRDAGRGWS